MNHSENTHNSLPASLPPIFSLFKRLSPFFPPFLNPLAHLIFSTQPRINFSRRFELYFGLPLLTLFFFSLCLLNSRKMPRKSLSSLAHMPPPLASPILYSNLRKEKCFHGDQRNFVFRGISDVASVNTERELTNDRHVSKSGDFIIKYTLYSVVY